MERKKNRRGEWDGEVLEIGQEREKAAGKVKENKEGKRNSSGNREKAQE